eukprot:3917849-Amphidinium_carterae.1
MSVGVDKPAPTFLHELSPQQNVESNRSINFYILYPNRNFCCSDPNLKVWADTANRCIAHPFKLFGLDQEHAAMKIYCTVEAPFQSIEILRGGLCFGFGRDGRAAPLGNSSLKALNSFVLAGGAPSCVYRVGVLLHAYGL